MIQTQIEIRQSHYLNGFDQLLTSLALPLLISGIIAILIFGLARFTKTSDTILTITVNLEAMKKFFSEMEKRMNKVLDNIHDVIFA